MTDILIEEINSCLPSPASVVTLLPPDKNVPNSEPSTIDGKDLNDIKWVLNPSTVSRCFGITNNLKSKDTSCHNAFLEIQNLKTALMDVENNMQSLEQTFNDSVLALWNTELRLISFSFISFFFSPKGPECPKDFRFHLNLIKSYILFGSPQFSMAISDAMFKDSPYGLNLNGSSTKLVPKDVNLLLLEICKPLDWLDFDMVGDKNSNPCLI
jgi:hypothetical protein